MRNKLKLRKIQFRIRGIILISLKPSIFIEEYWVSAMSKRLDTRSIEGHTLLAFEQQGAD